MKRFRLLFLIAASLFTLSSYFFAQTPQKEASIVAMYADKYSVTVDDLNKYVVDWLYNKKYRNREDIYRNALHDMLVNQFKRMDFFDRELDKNNELIKSVSRIINEELIVEYFKSLYLDKYTTEETVKNVYGMMDRKIVYKQIELTKNQNITNEQLDSLEQRALEIKSEIEKGRDIDELIIKYSSNNNGIMPPVDWKQALLDPVANVVFKLNKGDLRILNTPSSIKIIEVTDILPVDVPPFDSVRHEIVTYLKNIFYTPAYEEFENDKKKLIDETKLSWDDAALEQLLTWSKMPDFYKGKYSQIISEEINKGNNKIILTYNGGNVDYKKLLSLLDNILILKDSENISVETLKEFLLEALRTEMIVEKAEALNLKKNIFNPFTDDIVLKNHLVRTYNTAVIESKIPSAAEEDLYDFYLKHKNDLYYQLEKRNIFVMVFPTKEEADSAYRKIENGVPFEKVKSRYLVKTYIKDRSGEIKSLRKDEKPVFGKVAFALNESQVAKPVEFEENNKKSYALIKCYKIRPEKQLSFEEAKDKVVEDFKNYHRERIEKEIEEYLMNKYKPVIYEEALRKLIDGT
ncbi:peptidylprolyl isomerase [Melioribacter sp. Ez-97]|uniref:peptidylprolyl isomerase n=1 Tax=Melioribacter sp. Ez-97 TaxID=3423434 RepID=UPI003ED8734B